MALHILSPPKSINFDVNGFLPERSKCYCSELIVIINENKGYAVLLIIAPWMFLFEDIYYSKIVAFPNRVSVQFSINS